MAQESAIKFVEKLYSDDSFVKEVYRHGGFNKNAGDDEKNRLICKAAGELGYDFSVEEYNNAMTARFEGVGVMESIKIFWRFNKAVKAAKKSS